MQRPIRNLARSAPRAQLKKFFALFFLLASLLCIPFCFVESARSSVVSLFSLFSKNESSLDPQDALKLEVENHHLRNELSKLRAYLSESAFLEEIGAENFLIAKVIYRDPTNWSSSFWIDVGEKNNREQGKVIIGKNSPVLSGKSVVGAIDHVGEKQSRVRLITDSGLNPSVRAVRGRAQNQFFLEHIDAIVRGCNAHPSLIAPSETSSFLNVLEKMKEKLQVPNKDLYLAKGILQGSGAPLWRSKTQILQGLGFNFDFADEFGKPDPAVPLLSVGDLLITTGMDGVFPANLRVAQVVKIHPLNEGAYTYSLEAVSTAQNINSLHYVSVIPPLGYQESSKQKNN